MTPSLRPLVAPYLAIFQWSEPSASFEDPLVGSMAPNQPVTANWSDLRASGHAATGAKEAVIEIWPVTRRVWRDVAAGERRT
jgi:hypothetical protein